MRPKASTPRKVIPRNVVSGVSSCIMRERTQETQDRRKPVNLSSYFFFFNSAVTVSPPRPTHSIGCFVSMRTEKNIIFQIFVHNTIF